MADINDFGDGTAFFYLVRSDFQSEERFEAYAQFMGVPKGRDAIYVPIDGPRAKARARLINQFAQRRFVKFNEEASG